MIPQYSLNSNWRHLIDTAVGVATGGSDGGAETATTTTTAAESDTAGTGDSTSNCYMILTTLLVRCSFMFWVHDYYLILSDSELLAVAC